MKKSILFALSLGIILSSCGGNSGHSAHEGHATEHSAASESPATTVASNASASAIIDSYLAVKDALVADDQAGAAEKSVALSTALKNLEVDAEESKKLRQEATASAERLASGDLASQRENFQALSVTLKDLLKIVGTDRTLYQQHCPMYKNNTGGIWLSASEEIKNPLFGSKMLACGRVEETLTSL